MKKMKLLSRAEMKKVAGGAFCPENLCFNEVTQQCDFQQGEECISEYNCPTYCKDSNQEVVNPNQQLLLNSCANAVADCQAAYPLAGVMFAVCRCRSAS